MSAPSSLLPRDMSGYWIADATGPDRLLRDLHESAQRAREEGYETLLDISRLTGETILLVRSTPKGAPSEAN